MGGDLLTLHMMVVSAAETVRDHWRAGSSLASVPIEYSAGGASEAHGILKKADVDILVIDGALAADERDSLIDASAAKAQAPLVAVLAGEGMVPPAGASVTLANPSSADEACALVERCVRMRLPKRILLVDDSSTMRSIVRKILSACQFVLAVSEAESGISALDKVNDGCDLALIDCDMPEFDGFETLAELRRIAPKTAVVMMTATDDQVLADKAYAAGAFGFIKKPFYPADIDAILVRMFDIPQAD
jgi:CheY-like chemotaxis protein